jgi:hypothetical protein
MGDGRIYLEVNRDAYRKIGDPYKLVQAIAENEALTDAVDWQRVKAVIKERAEVAREITAVPHEQTAEGGDS